MRPSHRMRRIAIAAIARGAAAALASADAWAGFTLIEGDAVIVETTMPLSAIGDPVSFAILVDLSAPEPMGRYWTYYADAPGNGFTLISRLEGDETTYDITCGNVASGVWNDDATMHDQIGIGGGECTWSPTSLPAETLVLQLEDVSSTALASPLIPDAIDLADFADLREVQLIASQTYRFRAEITRIPEPAAPAGCAAALLALGLRGRRSARGEGSR